MSAGAGGGAVCAGGVLVEKTADAARATAAGRPGRRAAAGQPSPAIMRIAPEVIVPVLATGPSGVEFPAPPLLLSEKLWQWFDGDRYAMRFWNRCAHMVVLSIFRGEARRRNLLLIEARYGNGGSDNHG
jgi:hypothetical protein